jgi:hypothetical protein
LKQLEKIEKMPPAQTMPKPTFELKPCSEYGGMSLTVHDLSVG